MCRYCKRLEELRKQDKKLFDDVLSSYKKLLCKDDKLFRRILLFLCVVIHGENSLPKALRDELHDLVNVLDCIVLDEGGDRNEKKSKSSS